MTRLVRAAAAVLAALLLAGPALPAETTEAYRQEIEQRRADREARLRSPEGWLSLVGLFWLAEGENSFGSGPGNDLVFPQPAPQKAGRVVLDGASVRLFVHPGVEMTRSGRRFDETILLDDTGGSPDVLQMGRLSFHLIRRGERRGLRVKDPESPALRRFSGLSFYPVDADYRIDGRFQPYETPREVTVATVTGEGAAMLAAGRVEFSLQGRTHQLEALVYDPADTRLFLIFKDSTSGKETYGAGRYLYADVDGDTVNLDFNLAYNPPCAFTPFATCPLPPRGNRLEVPVSAGEKYDEH